MHKITKGLKKKKKVKKSKHKEEELFKPEELEAYRKEHQQPEAGTGENEEWKKFLAITSGIDDVLKKTQGDLNRIKSTSFFQRTPPPSQSKPEVVIKEVVQPVTQVPEQAKLSPANIGIVEVSESESEYEEDDDDIFDTAYIDAIATGEVKLAYIPESPVEEAPGDDPFDTTYAENAILGPAIVKKGKKLVPIGAAVEVLTGRVQLPTCSTQRPVPNKRQILKEKDLLLGSFDDNANSISLNDVKPSLEIRTLLDEDAPLSLSEEPIDLSKSLYIPTPEVNFANTGNKGFIGSELITHFPTSEDLEDDEFALLAAENLNKQPFVNHVAPLPTNLGVVEEWNAFANEESFENSIPEPSVEVDPFDTTFAENILPGKAELKQIESEILNSVHVDFKPKPEVRILRILNKINVTESGNKLSNNSLTCRVPEADLNYITPGHRDLLGGSNTDLTALNEIPLTPAAKPNEDYIEYCDPFDTSIVETVKLPGQTELKFLEKELLGDAKKTSLSDEDFDPRAEDIPRERAVSRPDVLNISGVKTVCFDVKTLRDKDFIDTGDALSLRISKPPTPFYVRKNSVPDPTVEEDLPSDPFDTSYIIGETLTYEEEANADFFGNINTETDTQLGIGRDVSAVKNQVLPILKRNQIDLLSSSNDISVNVSMNDAEQFDTVDETLFSDPFDTSIANSIFSGTTVGTEQIS